MWVYYIEIIMKNGYEMTIIWCKWVNILERIMYIFRG